MESFEGRNNSHFIFCSYGRLELLFLVWESGGEAKSYEEAGCVWCDDGLLLEGVISLGPGATSLVEGDIGDNVGCHGMGVEKDQIVVVEDEGNGGGVGSEG